MTHNTRSLGLATDAVWTQEANYSSDRLDNWRCLSVSARLSWPDDLFVNGYHRGSEMDWLVECYDNTLPATEEGSRGALGLISFRKDLTGHPGGIVALSLQHHGFQDLWERAAGQVLSQTTVELGVLGILAADDEHGPRWLTSKAAQLTVYKLRFIFNQVPGTEGDAP